MALTGRSLFLYGYTVDATNYAIDFRAVAAETPRQASLRYGSYSLTSLMEEVVRALQEKDPSRLYVVVADRSVSGGTQNRITIASSGTHLSLLFASGSRTASNSASLLGFTATDKTGATFYTGTLTTGTGFSPNAANTFLTGYNYLSTDNHPRTNGQLNIATSGQKEVVVFNTQYFWQVDFRYITASEVTNTWVPFMAWIIQGKLLEFTPLITSSSTFHEGTLESATGGSNGLEFMMNEMLPQFPNLYQTGLMKFRKRLVN